MGDEVGGHQAAVAVPVDPDAVRIGNVASPVGASTGEPSVRRNAFRGSRKAQLLAQYIFI